MQVVGISARFEFGCNTLFPLDNTLFPVALLKPRGLPSFNSPGFSKYNLTWVSDMWSTWVEDLISEHDKIYKAATCGEYPRTYPLAGLLMECQGARVRKLSILCPILLHFSLSPSPLLITGISSKIRGGFENSSLEFHPRKHNVIHSSPGFCPWTVWLWLIIKTWLWFPWQFFHSPLKCSLVSHVVIHPPLVGYLVQNRKPRVLNI